MKRTAGTLVLHSLLPIGAIINMWFCTFLCFSVYLLGYSYLSVVMDHSHPSMASFWEVRTRFCSKPRRQKIDPKTALTKNWSQKSFDQRLIFAFFRRKALGSTNPLSSPFFHLSLLSHFSGSWSKLLIVDLSHFCFALQISNEPQVLVTEWMVQTSFHLLSPPLQPLLDIPRRRHWDRIPQNWQDLLADLAREVWFSTSPSIVISFHRHGFLPISCFGFLCLHCHLPSPPWSCLSS